MELAAEIAAGAVGESPLWSDALLPDGERRAEPVFSPLGEPRFALGVETIYEGYLVHYGSSRLFAPDGDDRALLLGDYLYAHGLARIAALGDVEAIADLAQLISLCAQLRGNGRAGDGPAWAATIAELGRGGLDGARDALRETGDPRALEARARAGAGDDAVDRALAAHEALLG